MDPFLIGALLRIGLFPRCEDLAFRESGSLRSRLLLPMETRYDATAEYHEFHVHDAWDRLNECVAPGVVRMRLTPAHEVIVRSWTLPTT